MIDALGMLPSTSALPILAGLLTWTVQQAEVLKSVLKSDPSCFLRTIAIVIATSAQ
jgi:hypothetical protein